MAGDGTQANARSKIYYIYIYIYVRCPPCLVTDSSPPNLVVLNSDLRSLSLVHHRIHFAAFQRMDHHCEGSGYLGKDPRSRAYWVVGSHAVSDGDLVDVDSLVFNQLWASRRCYLTNECSSGSVYEKLGESATVLRRLTKAPLVTNRPSSLFASTSNFWTSTCRLTTSPANAGGSFLALITPNHVV